MSLSAKVPYGSLLKGTAPKRKPQKRAMDASHLDYIRQLPCCITGTRPVEAAHVRFASKIWGKPITGIGTKPHDKWCVPLSPEKHREQHAGGELEFWKRHGVDPLVLASRLYEASGDVEAGEKIIREARP